MKTKLKKNIIFLAISFFFISLLFIPLNYYIVAEGNVYSAKDFILLPETRTNHVLLPSVLLYENTYFSKLKSSAFNKLKTNIYELIYAGLSSKAEIRNLHEYITKETTSEDFENQIMQITMISISNIKLVVAAALNKSWEELAPIKINMTNEGPSASVGIALDLYNQLASEDILKERKVAAFGTITDNGTVISVAEAGLKVKALRHKKIDLVFIPKRNNIKEIANIKYPFKIIPVSTFDEVLEYLKKEKS